MNTGSKNVLKGLVNVKMNVLGYLLIFTPAIVASIYQCILAKIKLSFFPFLCLITLYSVMICFCMAGIGVLRGHGGNSFYTFFESMKNIVKYVILSMILAGLLPNIVSLIIHTKYGRQAMERLSDFTMEK